MQTLIKTALSLFIKVLVEIAITSTRILEDALQDIMFCYI